jgi:hypothetical protein
MLLCHKARSPSQAARDRQDRPCSPKNQTFSGLAPHKYDSLRAGRPGQLLKFCVLSQPLLSVPGYMLSKE